MFVNIITEKEKIYPYSFVYNRKSFFFDDNGVERIQKQELAQYITDDLATRHEEDSNS